MSKEIEIEKHYKCFLRVIDKCTGRAETIDTKAVIVGDDKIEFTLELNKLSTENQRIIDITHENKILAKALELACEKLANIIIKDCTSIKEGEEALLYCDKNWFLQQAKRS